MRRLEAWGRRLFVRAAPALVGFAAGPAKLQEDEAEVVRPVSGGRAAATSPLGGRAGRKTDQT